MVSCWVLNRVVHYWAYFIFGSIGAAMNYPDDDAWDDFDDDDATDGGDE